MPYTEMEPLSKIILITFLKPKKIKKKKDGRFKSFWSTQRHPVSWSKNSMTGNSFSFA